jgi:hypothetical protein
MISPRHRLATIALATLALSGCAATSTKVSTSAFKGESGAVAQRIAAYQSHARTRDTRRVCGEDLAVSVTKGLSAKGSNCDAVLKTQLAQIDPESTELTILSIEIKGPNRARASVKSIWSGKLVKGGVELVKEAGAWRIAGLS